MGPLKRLFLLFMMLNGAWTEDTVTTVYFTDGGSLTLEAKRTTSENITNILWKFNGNLLAEWAKDVVPLAYYGTFKGRATLHTDTGRLVIDKMSEAHKGVYSSTINHKVQSESFNATLIKEVPQPEVVIIPLTCQATSSSCNFTCRADIEGAGPVTYNWKKGDGEWDLTERDASHATIIVTKAQYAHVKTFTCRIKNPVSEKESKPEPNLLFDEVVGGDSVVGKVVGGLFGALFLVAAAAAGIGFAVWKKKNPSVNITEPPAGNGHPTTQPSEDGAVQPHELESLNSSGPNTNPDVKENL